MSALSGIGTVTLFATVWLSPVVAGMAYDAVTRRRVHPAYIIGLEVLLIGFSRVLFTESDGWQRIVTFSAGSV